MLRSSVCFIYHFCFNKLIGTAGWTRTTDLLIHSDKITFFEVLERLPFLPKRFKSQ
jgi:hypothetical protein